MKIGDKVRINPETYMFLYGSSPMIRIAKEKGTILEVSRIEGNDRVYARFPDGMPYIFQTCELIPAQQGHPHAEAMAQYAEDAKTSERPWELWQLQTISGQWLNCTVPVAWNPDKRYRRKPRTHIVNGFEVPAPDLRGQFASTPTSRTWFSAVVPWSWILAERNLLFTTASDAMANAKAMVKVDPYK